MLQPVLLLLLRGKFHGFSTVSRAHSSPGGSLGGLSVTEGAVRVFGRRLSEVAGHGCDDRLPRKSLGPGFPHLGQMPPCRAFRLNSHFNAISVVVLGNSKGRKPPRGSQQRERGRKGRPGQNPATWEIRSGMESFLSKRSDIY